MDSAFAQPSCPVPHSASSTSPITVPINPDLPHVRNDALVYLAIAVAGFAAVPTLFWLREKRYKDKERRRNRAVLESLKAKMDATKSSAIKSPEPAKTPAHAVVSVLHEANVVEDCGTPDVDEIKEKKKRSRERRKRGRDREPYGSMGVKNRLSSPRPPPAPKSRRDSSPMDNTPRAPGQPRLSEESPDSRAPSPLLSSVPDIASPTPLSLIPSSFHPPSPQTHSETSSHPGLSRSPSASPTTAPHTPPPFHPSDSLPPLVAVKPQEPDSWVPKLSHIPRDDPAWDWDGQSSTYSAGSPSRAPSSSSTHPQQLGPNRPRSVSKAPSPRPVVSSLASPAESTLPSAPSLVFPSLNAHPPPGASLTTQIASLKGALEASRTREEKHRHDAEHWSKECDLVKWRWNEAAEMWRRHEAELQSQIHHLVLQVQTLRHTMQAASLSPTIPFIPAPGQPSFPFAMPFPSHHGSPLGMQLASASPDMVNEDLAEAILKRPGSIRPTASGSRRNSQDRASPTDDAMLHPQAKFHDEDEVIEFEFPTLLERPGNSPQIDTNHERDLSANHEGVEIFT